MFKEELLINFRELVSEHSGENMAEAVWETLKRYGIESRVSLFSTNYFCANYFFSDFRIYA